MDLTLEMRQTLLRAAWEIIRRRLSGEPGQLVFPPNPALLQPAGCFVSLHQRQSHALCGCIGSIDSSRPLYQSLGSAAQSVLQDPRFAANPVTLAELPELEVEITVLGPLQPVPGPLDFDPAQQGIYLTVNGRSGCFLPQVARETGWNREQLLTRLCTEKMGFAPDAWKDPSAVLQVFSAVVIGPQGW